MTWWCCAPGIRRGRNGSFDFSYLGTTAVLFTVPRGGAPVLRRTMGLRPDSTDRHQVNWGSAATVAGDWLYVYGTRLDRDPLVFGRALFVARAPVRTPADRAGWRFWDGRSWQPDPARSAPVLPAAGGVSQTLSVHPVGGGFVAVSKRGRRPGELRVHLARTRPDRSVDAAAGPAGAVRGRGQGAQLRSARSP